MQTFIELVKRAFGVWWRYKLLWPLGMLAALVGYGDAGVGGNFNFSQPIGSDPEGELPPWIENLPANQLLQDVVANPLPYVLAIIAFALGLALIFALVGALAHGAMIRVTDAADGGYAASFGDGLRVGLGRMTPIVMLNLLLALPVILAVAVAAVVGGLAVASAIASAVENSAGESPGTILAAIGGLILCLIALVLVFVVLGALLGIWSRIAQRACVIEGRGAVASLGRAWGLIRRNLGLTVITWFFQAILGGMVSTVLALPMAALAFPLIIATLDGGAPPWGLLALFFFYAIAATLVVGGLLTAFNSILWTMVFKTFVVREQPPAYSSYGPG